MPNAVADAARIAETPAAAAAMCTSVPVCTPSIDTSPARRPWSMLRATM